MVSTAVGSVWQIQAENIAQNPQPRLIEQYQDGIPRDTRGSIHASHPVAPGLILGDPKNFSLGVAEIYGTSG